MIAIGRASCRVASAGLRGIDYHRSLLPHGPPLKIPKRLEPLLEDGLIDGVVRQLTSGKEAMVFVVTCGDEVRCAKVYKEANKRAFRQSVDYTENRKVRNSRQARAMAKGTRYGREAQEAAWQNAEVDALFRLAAAGVRVPTPFNFHEGVLLMELVTGHDDLAAPRLADVAFDAVEAREHHRFLLGQVVRMLHAGVIHGDLSEFNILIGREGPVIIDLPQAVDAAGNNHARRMLERDVANLRNYFGRFAPELLDTEYGAEIWSLYESGALRSGEELTGRFQHDDRAVDLRGVLREISDAQKEEAARLMRLQERT
jgi:RIO kinase 1